MIELFVATVFIILVVTTIVKLRNDKSLRMYIYEDYLYHVKIHSHRVHKDKPHTVIYASVIDRSSGEKFEKAYPSREGEPLRGFVETIIDDYLLAKGYSNMVKQYENKYSGDIYEN